MSGFQSESGVPLQSETGSQILPESYAGPHPPPGPPTFKYFAPPPTRLLSWAQMCLEADPTFQQASLRPWVYEFSNGRLFVEAQPIYGSFGITDDEGNVITDDFGTQITSDNPSQSSSSTGGFPFGPGQFGVDAF